MADPTHAVPILRTSVEHLTALTEGLSAEELAGESFCDDWSIAQVLSHLGSQWEIMLTFLEAAQAGEPEPSTDGFPAVWDRWNALSPEEQRTQGLASVQRGMAAIEAIEEPQLSELRVSLFGGAYVLDLPGFARFRLVEQSIHTWDVDVALDPTARIAPDAAALVLELIPTMVGFYAKGDAVHRLRVEATDVGSTWLLTTGASPSLVDWADQEVDGTLRLTGEQLIRLVYGRILPADELELTGAVSREQLLAVFPGS
jgi:uncharacterized protein (TIGR03083 family)